MPNQKLKVALIYDEILNPPLINIFSDSLFEFSHYNTNQIEYQKLNNCALIVLDGLKKISSGLSKNLEEFINNGGHMLIFLHEDVEINSYNNFPVIFSSSYFVHPLPFPYDTSPI